ncbi:MAG: Na/Pi cotransporter family protein [Bacillota bacterium]|nr:Na/Pi cotransporter family protein [Bacillota bacterium]
MTLILLGLCGGLGLFIYGMQFLSDALQRAAGQRFRQLLERLTSTLPKGVLVGAAVTAVIQSSSATTVMIVGLVNAGLLTLRQALGVTLGANIGTTVTAQIVAFKLTDFALAAVGIGFALSFFGRNRALKRTGEVLFGLGLLFLGLKIMSQYLVPLIREPWAANLITAFSVNPLLGVLVGAALTAVVQSSSATTGLFIALAAEGALDLSAAVPLVFGANIGTCATALLASIGTSLGAKRAAAIHLLIKIIGVLLVLPFIRPFDSIVAHLGDDVPRQIANAHTLFNILTSVVILPFAGAIIRLATWLLPGEVEVFERGPRYIDHRFLAAPAMAIAQARREAHRMGEFVRHNLRVVFEGILAGDASVNARMVANEQVINELERAITDYLAALSVQKISEEQSKDVADLILAVKDLERVGDHAENLARLAAEKAEGGIAFSPEATAELQVMYALVDRAIGGALHVLETGREDPESPVAGLEDQLDVMEKHLRLTHIRRLTERVCTPAAGIIFLDVASHFERIGDHAASIGRLTDRRGSS